MAAAGVCGGAGGGANPAAMGQGHRYKIHSYGVKYMRRYQNFKRVISTF